MVKSNKGIALVLLLISGFMLYQSAYIPKAVYSAGGAGAALFPQIWSIFMGLLSVVLLVRSYRKDRTEQEKKLQSFKELWSKEKYVYIMLAAVVGYVLLLDILGFVVSTFLFLMLTIKILGRKNISMKSVILISAVSTLCTYLVFVKVLNVIMPSGFLI